MNLGLIGLGNMGYPMAENLLRAGHHVHVWARRPEAVVPLIKQGAAGCATPAVLAANCEVIFLCVTADVDVETIALGETKNPGLIHGVKPGAVIIDHSTISPATTRRLHALFLDQDVAWLDAPVSGGVEGARAGTLSIMVGGEESSFEKVCPLLKHLGKTIVYVGASGAGQITKACNQMFLLANIQAVAEAAKLAAAHGLDFTTVRTALQGGSAASKALDACGERMARRDFAPGVPARLHHKDFAIIMDAAAKANCPLPIAAAVSQQLNALMAAGWGQEDSASLLRVLETT